MVSVKRLSLLKGTSVGAAAAGPVKGADISAKSSNTNLVRSRSEEGSLAPANRALSPQAPRASGTQSGRVLKVGLFQVLNDELEAPFSLADFYLFLRKEHSEENIEFYEEVERYKQFAKTNPAAIPRPNAAVEPISEEGSEEEQATAAFRAELQKRLNKIVEVYFTNGAEKELNIPSNIRKKLMHEIKERKNFNPEMFAPAIENVCTMMRLSSFPNFYKLACQDLKNRESAMV
ncbi:RGS domain-containing protein [Chytridium lagenaria]|nr:RGS domain-containing protein [Chytridium lagenaria]